MAEIKVDGFEQLSNKLKIKVPEVVRQMAFSVDASVASIGRKKEQLRAGRSLHMGYLQHTSHHGKTVEGQFSAWDPEVGWVSIHRQAGNGASGYRMSNFSWESPKKNSVTAGYTSQMANLWHRDVMYSRRSPWVGLAGSGPRTQFGPNNPREARYDWAAVPGILKSTVAEAIARTETRFENKLE